MLKQQRKKGFTLAETLIVVAIIAVLGALIVVGVIAYLRSLTKLEYDGYAKEIFIASQNHLSMAESQGFLGRTEYGTNEDDGIYYFVKDSRHTDVNNESTLLNLMLPFAAVDETVRENGCYVIRYHKDSATVLDVFYWQENGRFDHQYVDGDDGDYKSFLAKTEDKSALRTYGDDRSVIGWYGGADAQGLTHGDELLTPAISVINADQLKVVITDKYTEKNAPSNQDVKLKLIITGLTSGNKREIIIDRTQSNANGEQTIILDDITDGLHFYQQFCSDEKPHLIPGEDITIQAVEYNNAQLTNVAYSPVVTTNSLFAYNEKTGDESAHISYIRHLENLDPAVSGVNTTDTRLKHVTAINEVAAKQTTDLQWDSGTYDRITDKNGSQTPLASGVFKSIDADYVLNYDGRYNDQNHSINGITVVQNGNAGLFSQLHSGDTVANLKLVDFNISGKNAGALAGTADNADVKNVVVCNSGSDAINATIKGTENAGGLIGSAAGCDIERSAAAVIVESSNGNAGGLIGTASGGSVAASYSGGHTKNGSYKDVTYTEGSEEKVKYNVTGDKNAGGLIGQVSGTRISGSYSTCSASGATAGGFVGDMSGSEPITNSYSTGLVNGTAAGAFIGNLGDGSSLTGCLYYEIINEQFANGTDGKTGYKYMNPVGNKETSELNQHEVKISPIDANAGSYETFVGDDDRWKSAVAYDMNLGFYYQGKYNLKTVDQLTGNTTNKDLVSDHYGDWPSPEIWVINEPNT